MIVIASVPMLVAVVGLLLMLSGGKWSNVGSTLFLVGSLWAVYAMSGKVVHLG